MQHGVMQGSCRLSPRVTSATVRHSGFPVWSWETTMTGLHARDIAATGKISAFAAVESACCRAESVPKLQRTEQNKMLGEKGLPQEEHSPPVAHGLTCWPPEAQL